MVLASDGESTYALFLYGDLQWSQADLRDRGSSGMAIGSGAIGSGASGSGAIGSGAIGSGAIGSGASEPSSRYATIHVLFY